jgi:gliding motility-associated-like protein
VLVKPESLLDVPNAFSPGSQPNGTIKVERRGIATLNSFRIFNRWGTKVFETNDINQGWDGRFNGEPQPMGVYVYIVEATTNTGRRFTKQGNITLIR